MDAEFQVLAFNAFDGYETDPEHASKLVQMRKMGYNDHLMNKFKLILYNGNVNDAIKFYKSDRFCHLYCIDGTSAKYGCNINQKDEKNCELDHSFDLRDLIFNQFNYSFAKILCLYLIYLNKFNNNSKLFSNYATVLFHDDQKDNSVVLQSEKNYLKAIELDDKNHIAHCNYALLLETKLNKNDKAEYHYKKSLDLNPYDSIKNYNFGCFLYSKQRKYQQSLQYLTKACDLDKRDCLAHYMKAKALLKLQRLNECKNEFEITLKLNKKNQQLTEKQVNSINGQIHKLGKKISEKQHSTIMLILQNVFDIPQSLINAKLDEWSNISKVNQFFGIILQNSVSNNVSLLFVLSFLKQYFSNQHWQLLLDYMKNNVKNDPNCQKLIDQFKNDLDKINNDFNSNRFNDSLNALIKAKQEMIKINQVL